MPLNKDLQSIQEARDLVSKAKEAQLAFRKATQEQVDKIVKAMADAGYAATQQVGRIVARRDETIFVIGIRHASSHVCRERGQTVACGVAGRHS